MAAALAVTMRTVSASTVVEAHFISTVMRRPSSNNSSTASITSEALRFSSGTLIPL